MKRFALAVLMSLLPCFASAGIIGLPSTAGKQYFRLMDIHHPKTDAIGLYSIKSFEFIGGVTDIALITHATADGSLIPDVLQKQGFAPEPWVPLQVGIGGSAQTGYVRGHIGSSFNASSFLAQTAMNMLQAHPTGFTKGVTDLLTSGLALPGGSTVGFSTGLGLAANFISEGHFQSGKQMFPYQGLGPNLMNASCFSIGLAWNL